MFCSNERYSTTRDVDGPLCTVFEEWPVIGQTDSSLLYSVAAVTWWQTSLSCGASLFRVGATILPPITRRRRTVMHRSSRTHRGLDLSRVCVVVDFLAVCSRLRLSEHHRSPVIVAARLASDSWQKVSETRAGGSTVGIHRYRSRHTLCHLIAERHICRFVLVSQSRIIQNGIVYVFMYDDTIVTTIPIV